jgi:hypothetical protein
LESDTRNENPERRDWQLIADVVKVFQTNEVKSMDWHLSIA